LKLPDEIKRNITKGDGILIVFLLVMCAVLFVTSFADSEKLKAEIYVDGEKAHSIALSEVTESYTLTENYCQLLVEKDGVSFVYSDCGDKLCIKKGKLKTLRNIKQCKQFLKYKQT
jgi:hypothetical protein